MFNKGLIAAMEEIENEVPVADEEVVEEAVAVADESAEIQQDAVETDVTVAQIEDAVQAGEELEEIQEVAEEAVESGEGLTEEAAEMASIAIESICNRLGFKSKTRLVPATESFGNTNTRLVSTKLVVEGIKERLAAIWKAIKDAAVRVWEFIKQIVAKITKSEKRYQSVFEGLKKRLENVPAGATAKESTLKGSFTKAFSQEGKANFATFQAVTANGTKLVDFGKKATGALNAGAKALLELSADKAAAAGEAIAKQINADAGILKAISNVSEYGTGDAKEGTEKFYGPFVGNRALRVFTSKDNVVSLSFVPSKKDKADSATALTREECAKVIDQCVAEIKAASDLTKQTELTQKIMKEVSSFADKMASLGEKQANEGDNAEARKAASLAREHVKSVISMASLLSSQIPATNYSTWGAAASYVSASISNLKEKKD